jgi:hypothetical protein
LDFAADSGKDSADKDSEETVVEIVVRKVVGNSEMDLLEKEECFV